MNALLEQVILNKTKFITITGGVCSSLGKGVLLSSIGTLLKNAGYSVSVVKWDPYLNVDPGTMSPYIHGEVFVTADGAETDLDLGHYERIIELNVTRLSSVSSGQIFQTILEKERLGNFLGKDIQLIPHVVNEIKERLLTFACTMKTDFVLIEIGGTVGDMEGDIFLESIRQLRLHLKNAFMHCHLSYIPYLAWSGELKTKPTQHSVMLLKKAGLIPDALFLRTDYAIDQEIQEKISIMCGIPQEYIFQAITHKPIYKLFIDLYEQRLHEQIQQWFNLPSINDADMSAWRTLIHKIQQKKDKITIGLIAKYVGSNDPYMSVIEAIKAAGYAHNHDIELIIIDACTLTSATQLEMLDGIVVPGGFGERGIEGKIFAAKWARTNNIPYLGLCLGMQIMLIEFARSVLQLSTANSLEFDQSTSAPVVTLMDSQEHVTHKGGSMRLGAYPCSLLPGSRAYAAYADEEILERHRHRYEFNNRYRDAFEQAGMLFSGIYKEKNLVEIAEIKNHPFMLGSQFHPEFTSRPLKPHPLFTSFIEAVVRVQAKRAIQADNFCKTSIKNSTSCMVL